MEHQCFEILEKTEIRDGGDGVSREIQMFQMNILIEILDGLDVVVGKTQPG